MKGAKGWYFGANNAVFAPVSFVAMELSVLKVPNISEQRSSEIEIKKLYAINTSRLITFLWNIQQYLQQTFWKFKTPYHV